MSGEGDVAVFVHHPSTPQSLAYRRRASAVGKRAYEIEDTEKMLRQLHEALSWIQLAENEEVLTAKRHAFTPLTEN